jgi:hypothetical protein
MRYVCAPWISTPSSPPSRTRTAASPNADTSSAISSVVIARGTVPTIGLGTGLADHCGVPTPDA